MGKKIKEINVYIQKAAAFAQPILIHLRNLIHEACPEVEEKLKWSMPHFDYKGEMMCSMASFKQHCVFGFWKAALMEDKALLAMARSEEAMGHLGKITSLSVLPTDKMLNGYIKEAMKLNDDGIKLPPKKRVVESAQTDVPPDLKTALRKNKSALTHFDNFSPSKKKEYVLWITEAKTEDTRKRRIDTTIEWVAEGKIRNWKYQK